MTESTAPTHDIRIDVNPAYLEEQSDPGQDQYVFAYTITIENHGSEPVRLLKRRWLIDDANGVTREVKGDGVVGEKPRLAPGESFRYTSGAVLDTPRGTMHGSYQMQTDEGELFETKIPLFGLAAADTTLH